MDWYMAVLRKYAVFSGRARRREFWMFALVSFVISIILSIVDNILGFDTDIGILGSIYGLAVLIPSIAVAVRRLHDTGKSGWWLLIWLVPLIGFIVLIVFWAIEGERGPNQYGPDPKAGERGYSAGAPGAGGAPSAGGWPGTTPQPSATPQAPADWYADPTGRHQHRYWDGRAWTEHAADNGVATVDPLTAATGVQATGPQAEHPAWPTTPVTSQTSATSVASGPESATVVAPIPSVMAPAPVVTEPAPVVPAVDEPAPDEAATAVAEAPAPSIAPPAQTPVIPEAPAPPEAPQSPAGSPPSPTP